MTDPPGIHPSEPNYIWQNAGSNFGVNTDADPGHAPSTSAPNIIASPSMTGLMTQKGVTWKSYQEVVQYSTSPVGSAPAV